MRDFTLIFGCMFSGKTTRLIEHFHNSQVDQWEKIAVKPLIDNRYAAGSIHTHSGLQLPGHRISKAEEIHPLTSSGIKEVYIDEIQFFGSNVTGVVLDLTLQGIKVVAAGLDMDYKHEVFGPMGDLKKWASQTEKLYAKCTICNKQADRTFRKPTDSEAQILVGHSDLYEARCLEHWLEGMEGRI